MMIMRGKVQNFLLKYLVFQLLDSFVVLLTGSSHSIVLIITN